MYQYVEVFYNFETVFSKLNEAELTLEESKKGTKKDQSYTVKTHKHVPTSFALNVHYSKEVLTKVYEYLIYRGEGCTDVFIEKIEKILYDFASFPK